MTDQLDSPNLNERLRGLPSMDVLLADGRLAGLVAAHGREAVAGVAREALNAFRHQLATESVGAETSPAGLDGAVAAVIAAADVLAPPLRRVVNATGVIVHTNLGRAPLSRSALDAMKRVGAGYSNLEYDVSGGARGSRFSHLRQVLRDVTGAEDSLVVNNNAGALLLALSALCSGREVIVSRGELVEIGGGFRIPDVMRQSGARLVEVGTTNRTTVADYAAAIGEDTAAIVRVHPSNFRVVGFSTAPELGALSALAVEHHLPLIDDLGSGALIDPSAYGLAEEPLVRDSVPHADVALFSGDKLLGGPQSGIAIGRPDAIARMRAHPLSRALRPDKTTIAALYATLEHYRRGDAEEEIPVWKMIAADLEMLARRARRWSRACGSTATTQSAQSTVGGGSLPGETLETVVCAVTPVGTSADELQRRLREASPPIIARIQDDTVLLDPRTVDPLEDGHVERTLHDLTGASLPRDARAGWRQDASDEGHNRAGDTAPRPFETGGSARPGR